MICLPSYAGVSASRTSGAYDSDADAFFTAAGITDSTQKSAVNQLVLDLKSYGIWSKCFAIYPFVGGTAGTHKWNLKDPRDLDAAFRLVFTGGWTHASTGALPNGSTGFADTKFVPSTNGFTTTSGSVSYYSRTNNAASGGCEIGAYVSSPESETAILARFTGNLFYAIAGNVAYPSVASTDSSGFFQTNYVSSTAVQGWKGSSKVIAAAQTIVRPAIAIYIGAQNFTATRRFSNRECAFVSIGAGLSDTEAANLYTAVQAYQTTLSRQV